MKESPAVLPSERDLEPERLRACLAERHLVQDAKALDIRALGGGVSNIVMLVEGPGIRWVAKQALGKLRVRDDWRSDRGRIFREADAIRALRPVLGADAVPKLVYVDRDDFFLVMTAAPDGSPVWKHSLLHGEIDLAVARQAGLLLGKMIVSSQADRAMQERFGDRTVFDQLRIDPYYRTTARRAPEVRGAIEDLIGDSWKIQTSIVHGDYSPKNMLVAGGNIFLIDFEVVHWGDPAFDSAFLLNHLLLKALHQPLFRQAYLKAAQVFWDSLTQTPGVAAADDFERMTVRHLGALMRARIDGKSPVEYIDDDRTRDAARKVSREILLETGGLEGALGLAESAAAALS
jgi:fructosamine-3-kinase